VHANCGGELSAAKVDRHTTMLNGKAVAKSLDGGSMKVV
jgi:hypothetical protein